MKGIMKKVSAIALTAAIAGGVCFIPQNVYASVPTEGQLVELSQNLIRNSSLENNGANWSKTGDGSFTNYPGSAATGEYCGLLPSNTRNACVYQVVNVKPNTDYVATAKILVAKEGGSAFFNVKNENVSALVNNAEKVVKYNPDYDWKYQDVELKFNTGDKSKVSLCVMKWTASTGDGIYASQVYVDDVTLKEANAETVADYDMVWADDFKGNSLDTSKWGLELGTIRGVEQQHYTNSKDNVYVKDGNLVLEITNRKKEDQYKNPRGNRQVIYDSGSVRTHGKQEFLYGRIEMRAKLPKGKGVFPAFWTLGSDFTLDGRIDAKQGRPWPVCGEVDIMELTGKQLDTTPLGNQTVWQTLHYGTQADKDTGPYAGNGRAYSLPSGIFNDDYHVFGLNWSKGKMEWYVDDQIVRTVDYSSDPNAVRSLDSPQYIQMNLAAGGNWPGDAGSDLAGQKFEIDYVYYARNKQQQKDADEYYASAPKINGEKDVTMYEGDIPEILDGVTSTDNTTLDFSVEDEPMFTNVGGQTKVSLLCRGKNDAAKLATLKAGTYNLHYSASPENVLMPSTRRTNVLTVEERLLQTDLDNAGMTLEGKAGQPLSSIALPEGWSFENPDEILQGDTVSAPVKFSKNGFTKEDTANLTVTLKVKDYKIIEGINQTYTKEQKDQISIKGDGELNDFKELRVDDEVVDEKHYTVKEGSTIITFDNKYLNSLISKQHKIDLVWNDGMVSTTLTINGAKPTTTPTTSKDTTKPGTTVNTKPTTKTPSTGDQTNVSTYVMSIIAVVAIAGIIFFRRINSAHK